MTHYFLGQYNETLVGPNGRRHKFWLDRAVVLAHWVERLLLTPEFRSSNTVIGKFYLPKVRLKSCQINSQKLPNSQNFCQNVWNVATFGHTVEANF